MSTTTTNASATTSSAIIDLLLSSALSEAKTYANAASPADAACALDGCFSYLGQARDASQHDGDIDALLEMTRECEMLLTGEPGAPDTDALVDQHAATYDTISQEERDAFNAKLDADEAADEAKYQAWCREQDAAEEAELDAMLETPDHCDDGNYDAQAGRYLDHLLSSAVIEAETYHDAHDTDAAITALATCAYYLKGAVDELAHDGDLSALEATIVECEGLIGFSLDDLLAEEVAAEPVAMDLPW